MNYIDEPIDLCSLYDPIFEPPKSFLKECREYWANTMKPFHKTIERKIGNTTYVIETEFAGREILADKLRRMLMGDGEK